MVVELKCEKEFAKKTRVYLELIVHVLRLTHLYVVIWDTWLACSILVLVLQASSQEESKPIRSTP